MGTTERVPRTSIFGPLTVGVSAALVVGLAAVQALRAYDQPIPGLLVDPYGSVSGLALPTWRSEDQELWTREPFVPRYPDRIVAVEGSPLEGRAPGAFPAEVLRARLHDVATQKYVRLTIRRDERDYPVTLPLQRIGPQEIALLFGSYALVGVLLSWSGTLVLRVSQRREAGLAYAAACWASLAFLATLFDYHTTTALTPIFHLGRLGTALGCMWLAYAFPSPPRFPRAPRVGALIATWCALVLLVTLLVPGLSVDARRCALLASDLFFSAGTLVLPASVLVRLRNSEGRAHAELRSSAAGLLVAPVLIGVGMWPGGGLFYIALPWIIAAVPMSIGYALIRHNILAATLVLDRRHFLLPASIAGVLFAMASFGLVRGSFWPNGAAPPAVSGGLFVLLATGCAGGLLATGQRLFFGTTARFRPTIEQLSSDFSMLRDGSAIQRSVERTVTRWLSTLRVSVLETHELGESLMLPDRARLHAGEAQWTTDDALARRLVVPIRFMGELLGVIVVPPKRQGALFTRDELELLDTISNLAAIALHNARVLEKLEAFRKLELDVSRRDKSMALAVLGAEIAHEVAYPLNFFRYLLRRYAREEQLSTGDLEVAREEIERLERMLFRLKRFGTEAPHPTPVELEQPLLRALELVRELVREKDLRVTLDIPPGLTVLAEADPLLQVFANLLRNAAQASEAGGTIEVRASTSQRGLMVEVSDSGPGVPPEIQQSLFSPWVSGRADGLGLGLAITHRIVRNFGWDIWSCREGGRTRFRVLTDRAASPSPDSFGETR